MYYLIPDLIEFSFESVWFFIRQGYTNLDVSSVMVRNLQLISEVIFYYV